MPSNQERRVNKQYLLPSYKRNRVSKRTTERWRLVFQKSFEHCINKKENHNQCFSSTGNNSSLEHSTDINEQLPDINIHKNINPEENDQVSSTETSDSESSLDDSDGFSDDSNNYVYSTVSSTDSDSSSDSDSDSSSHCNTNSSSNNSHSQRNFHSTRFNTDDFQGSKLMFPEAQLTVADVMFMITAYSVQKNLTKRDEDDLIQLIKILAGPEFMSWNASQHARAKTYSPPKSKINTHFFCPNCNVVLISHNNGKKMKEKSVECTSCERKYKLKSESSNQFITVDLDYQLENLLHNKDIQKDLLQSLDLRDKNKVDGVIHTIYDCQLYKDVQLLSPQTLTYNVNTDGAPPFKSSNCSFWPIQLCINELSPEIRKQNIILGGMLLSSTEPGPELMKIYLSKFIDNAEKLMIDGINITMHNSNVTKNFKFHCLLICVDSVARPVMQNRYQYSGYHGCSWCYDLGEYNSSAVRYPMTENDPILRTHKDYVNDVENVEKLNRPINGVKGRSELLRLQHIDCIWSFPIDYMHGVLLGVTRQLWTIWTTPRTLYYLTPADRKEINNRFLQIKRPHEIHRLVRPIKTMAKWKASEWESWLLFDSLPCLVGILKKECFDSYCLFVSSIFTLLSGNITERKLIECELDLLQFVGECEQFYGKSVMTFNLHSMYHIGQSVRQSGPLCSSNTFILKMKSFITKKKLMLLTVFLNKLLLHP
ncbi:uncharacterized protein LOC141524073 [Cotesia typhae]|uniref:uncharacterized protein LOC141524073 n=1 Tax=Cotesia typhae TaxID=2053667 RepID=UPI003D69F348